MGCVSGPYKMGEDIELEEGEVGYFKSNDDASIDPDIVLSYIDEKLQSVLGHFHKDFEGGAENLGATYGAYGSFLSTYRRRRLPSIWSQPKDPQRVQINITQSPYHFHREGAARSFSSIPDATLREKDGTAEPRNMHSDKVPLGDDLIKNVFDLPSDQAAENLPLKHQTSPKKSLNSTDQKTLKFRIKVGSNKAKVLDSRPRGSSDERPKQQSCSTDINRGSLRNSSTTVDTRKEPVKIRIRKLTNNTIKGSLLGADEVKDNSFELISISGQGGSKLKRQEAGSSSVKKIKLDSPVDFPESTRNNKVNGITYFAKIDSDTLESDGDVEGDAGHLLQEGGLRATSDKLRMTYYKRKLPSESKNKSKVCQVNGKISSDSVNGRKKAGLSACTREKKDASMSRELYEYLFGHSEDVGCPVDPLEKPSGDRLKGSIDTVKDECGNMDRFKVKSRRNKVDHQQTSQSLVKNSLRYTVPPTNGLSSELEQTTKVMEMVQTTVAPEDSWVACDRCEQWRLLPNGRTPNQFPETWVCSMLDWLPGMNTCNFTEDETTEALRALYQPPLPANQDKADRVVTGVSSVDTHYNNLENPNVNSYNIVDGSKKHKVTETSDKGSKSVLNMSSIPRNIEQGHVRPKSLNAKQPDSGMKLMSNSFSQHLSSSGEAKLKRNSKRVYDHHVHPTAKKVKTKFGSQQQQHVSALCL